TAPWSSGSAPTTPSDSPRRSAPTSWARSGRRSDRSSGASPAVIPPSQHGAFGDRQDREQQRDGDERQPPDRGDDAVSGGRPSEAEETDEHDGTRPPDRGTEHDGGGQYGRPGAASVT